MWWENFLRSEKSRSRSVQAENVVCLRGLRRFCLDTKMMESGREAKG